MAGNSRRIAASAALVLFGAGLAAAAPAEPAKPVTAAFERFKALAGDGWPRRTARWPGRETSSPATP
jgi:hypothetical protein